MVYNSFNNRCLSCVKLGWRTVQRTLDGSPTSAGRISNRRWKRVQRASEMVFYIRLVLARLQWRNNSTKIVCVIRILSFNSYP